MARDFPDSPITERGGTSQADRVQPALDPSYVAIDERSARDLLVFAQAYSKELRYYDETDRPDGDWSGFLGQDPKDKNLEELAALVEAELPAGGGAHRVGRSHIALFLAFLRLLQHPRDLVNTLTRRHLTLYYEQLLRMSRKPAVPDRVHVLLRPAAGVDRVRLPGGTLLRAGKDSSGRERVYQTDRELVVSRAKVARLSTVYVQKEVVGLREARELHQGTREEAFLSMLAIALGDPRPGDSLPKYGGKDVTYPLLLELEQRVDFAATNLFMDFSDLDRMMRLVRKRVADDAEWREINRILEKAGKEIRQDPSWTLSPANPRDFSANLTKAVGVLDFNTLPEVDSIEELYQQRIRTDVAQYIQTRIRLPSADFDAMMLGKIRIDNEWGESIRILEQAGRRKRTDPSYTLDPSIPPSAPATVFAAKLQAAVGPVPFANLASSILPAIGDMDAYYDAILAIERYFHLNAAQLGYVLSTAEKPNPPGATEREWDNVYRLLTEARRKKIERIYADHRHALRSAREPAPTPSLGFAAMLRIVLGKMTGAPEPTLSELREYVPLSDDYAFLESVQARLVSGIITPDEWTRVYEVVELAQRAREKLPELAQQETWLDLHAAEDATKVAAEPVAGAGPKVPRWKTFGQKPPVVAPDRAPPGVIGWAICSPMLLLAQGTRTITLTLGFLSKQFDSGEISALFQQLPSGIDQTPFEIQVSTETGWLPLTAQVTVGDYRTLSKVSRTPSEPLQAIQLTLALGEAAPAVAPSREAARTGAPWPMLRLMLRRIWDPERKQYISHYEPFRDLTLAAVHLQVKAEGIVPSAIQNDDAVLNPKKPFEPFGTSPAVGSRFYVGDPEIVLKRLDSLTFHIDWRGVPSDLSQYYANYGGTGPFTTPFTAEITLVDHHQRRKVSAPVNLFASPDATKTRDIALQGIPAIVEAPTGSYHYRPSSDLPAGPQVSAWPRYFEWELTPIDFKHQVYPALVARKALELTAALVTPQSTVNPENYQVNPPYTPKIKSLRIDYSSQTELVLPDSQSASRADRLFHIHPFGANPIEAEIGVSGTRFLPPYDHEGELYIGIQNARPPETLSLLFQMAEGSANPDLSPVPIEWSYLSGDRWRTLHDGHLLLDATHGLIDSGIVQIALPPAEPSTRLPGDLYWIRAAIPYHADSVCDAMAIHAQAVSATFVDRGNVPDHLAQKLPERSITSLLQRIPQIAAVEQPYPSRGGRPAEAEGCFFTRVSERLRTKQRALNLWDYERLILERFPELYKVKCIPADASRDPDHPGAVTIVVIPEIRGQSLANPFEPKVPAALIAEIEAYLADKCPPQAVVRVRNARFVQVKVRVGVQFRGSGDEGFYKRLLNEELNRFLSPWAYDEGADIVIGRKIFANSIVSFIDSRDYVDYVATIKLFSSEDGSNFKYAQPLPGQGYFVSTDRPDGVLVAARQHEIDIIPEAGYQAASFTGINYMKIGLDLVVADSQRTRNS